MERLRLGVNIDHVATLRNARGGSHPDPLRAALLIEQAGGDGVTVHLREDRRHIQDADVARIKNKCPLPLNFEMANTEDMIAIARQIRPNACCLVPEKRQERTTECGLDIVEHEQGIKTAAARLHDHGIRVSLFIDPDLPQLEAAARTGADIVELHTGTFCDARGTSRIRDRELARLREAAKIARSFNLEPHAGHGINLAMLYDIAAIAELVELNIGHALIGEALFKGFVPAIREMRALMDAARAMS